MSEQVERSFQRQPNVFMNGKRVLPKYGLKKRWYNDVGLGFKTPREAKEGSYIDKKCPFTSNVSIRGRILTGTVVSTKMKRTIIIRREYLHYIRKYNRFEKRHSNFAAHCSPCFVGIKPGDVVTAGECRPLSKTVRFNVLKIQKRAIAEETTGKQFSKF
jgi:small subunit ribosomal protein S11e